MVPRMCEAIRPGRAGRHVWACRSLSDVRWISAARKLHVAYVPLPGPARMSPAGRGAHPWHQISLSSCTMSAAFQVNVGFHKPWTRIKACPGLRSGVRGDGL